MSDEIAHVAADLFTGVVDENLCADLFHLALQAHGDMVLLARETVDLNELDQEVFETLLIDQARSNFGLIHGQRFVVVPSYMAWRMFSINKAMPCPPPMQALPVRNGRRAGGVRT